MTLAFNSLMEIIYGTKWKIKEKNEVSVGTLDTETAAANNTATHAREHRVSRYFPSVVVFINVSAVFCNAWFLLEDYNSQHRKILPPFELGVVAMVASVGH